MSAAAALRERRTVRVVGRSHRRAAAERGRSRRALDAFDSLPPFASPGVRIRVVIGRAATRRLRRGTPAVECARSARPHTDGQTNIHTTYEDHAVRRGDRRITRGSVSVDFVHQYQPRRTVPTNRRVPDSVAATPPPRRGSVDFLPRPWPWAFGADSRSDRIKTGTPLSHERSRMNERLDGSRWVG